MSLPTLWFVLIAVLWSGYFLLEGFDFGVGMLLPFLPRSEAERATLFRAIGPTWDGNEVWLITAGGATFAAFPAWYATMFSGFYLALLLVLVFLIVRVLSFEWRSRTEDPRWRAIWMWANTIGSFGAALIWGVGLACLLQGTPIDSAGNFTGDLASLFTPYTVLAGLAVVALFVFHGATFLTLRATDQVHERACRFAGRLAIPALVLAVIFLGATVAVAVNDNHKSAGPLLVPAAIGVAAVVAAAVLVRAGRYPAAFAATALTTVMFVVTLFAGLYPRVMVSSTSFANSLSIDNAASAHYTLAVMSVVALIFVPIILLYQVWAYYIFRHRVGIGETE